MHPSTHHYPLIPSFPAITLSIICPIIHPSITSIHQSTLYHTSIPSCIHPNVHNSSIPSSSIHSLTHSYHDQYIYLSLSSVIIPPSPINRPFIIHQCIYYQYISSSSNHLIPPSTTPSNYSSHLSICHLSCSHGCGGAGVYPSCLRSATL